MPSEVRDERGNWSAQMPILDTLIALPMEDRDLMQMLNAICQVLKTAAGVTVDFPLMRGGVGAWGVLETLSTHVCIG